MTLYVGSIVTAPATTAAARGNDQPGGVTLRMLVGGGWSSFDALRTQRSTPNQSCRRGFDAS
jgi:hypothetical protein